MTNQKIILLNGPKGSGKDTAALWLKSSTYNSVRIGFADHLKIATHAAYGLVDIPFDFYESKKDKPSADFLGLTPRHAYIAHSESYMKKLHGNRVFGMFFTKAAVKSGAAIVFVPDSGFVEEAEEQCERVGKQNVLLLRLYRDGHTFAGDSRSYIEVPGVTTIDINNNETVGKHVEKCLAIVQAWLGV